MSMHKEIKHLSLSNFLVLKVKSVLSRSYHIHNQEQPSTNPQFGSFFYTQHTVWDTACLQPLLCLHAWPWGTRVFHPMLETTHMSLPAFVLIKTARWEIETWKNTLSPFLLRCGRVSSCLESVGKKKKKKIFSWNISSIGRSKGGLLCFLICLPVMQLWGEIRQASFRWHRATDWHCEKLACAEDSMPVRGQISTNQI